MDLPVDHNVYEMQKISGLKKILFLVWHLEFFWCQVSVIFDDLIFMF